MDENNSGYSDGAQDRSRGDRAVLGRENVRAEPPCFAQRSIREPKHEASYLGCQRTVRHRLDELLERAEPHNRGRHLSALIAPHIDLHRGHRAYGWAYGELKDAPPADLYVIFGTAHQAMRECFAATSATYATPLGELEVETKVLTQLCERYGPRVLSFEHAHVEEHSIEFQTLFLAHRFMDVSGDRRPKILPILCGAQFRHVCGRQHPRKDPQHAHFLRHLAEILDEYPGRVTLIAGVDLAHMGPEFGHDRGLGETELTVLASRDELTMQHAAAVDADAYWHDVTADRNFRQICGLAPTYAMLRVMESRDDDEVDGVVLGYDQAVDLRGNVVSYASAAFYEE